MAKHKGRGISAIEYPTGMNQNCDPSQAWIKIKPDGLVDVSSSSFPSKHAAYATFYSWLAITVAFRVDPRITRRSLLIAAGLAATAVIGLTRVYLRVHWLSDVNAGWALGFSAFAAAGAIALLVTHFRDNPRPDDPTAERGSGAPACAGN